MRTPQDEGRQCTRPARSAARGRRRHRGRRRARLIGWRIPRGRTTVGDFTGFVSALLLPRSRCARSATSTPSCRRRVASLKRYYAAGRRAGADRRPPGRRAACRSRRRGPLPACASAIATMPALDGIDLVAPGGKTTALVGRSGSGKSTLLSLVPRLYDVPAGPCRDRRPGRARRARCRSLRSQIAVVSQDVVLFDDTVRANIAFGRPDATEEEIVEAAQGGGGPRLHQATAGGLRDARRRAAAEAVGRRAPAHRHRPRLSEGCADPAARRGDQRARRRIRAPRPGGARRG